MISQIQSLNSQSASKAVVTGVAADTLSVAQVPHTTERSVQKVDMQQLQAQLSASLEKINQAMRDGGRNINFSVDKSVNGPIVVVRNSDTGDVIRQIPNEAVVSVAHNIDALKGVLYNGLS